jgi:hypothetical protein
MTTKKTTPAATDAIAEATDTAASPKATKAARGGAARRPPKNSAKTAKPHQRGAAADTKAKSERKAPSDTKQAKLIAMLQAKDGATIEEIATAFGWQNHTVRGALYGALKKKLGLEITSEKVEGRGRVYRIGN